MCKLIGLKNIESSNPKKLVVAEEENSDEAINTVAEASNMMQIYLK